MENDKKDIVKRPEGPWELLRRMNQEHPAPEDLRGLRKVLEETPGLWQEVADLADQAASVLVTNVTATPVVKELVRGAYHGLKRDLGHEAAPVLEKVLISQVALAWLRLNILEQGYTGKTMSGTGSFRTEEGDYWERRLCASQRRFLRACETLARVRRIPVAALQVNIARQQVNVAGRA